jgi:hypothetical protein
VGLDPEIRQNKVKNSEGRWIDVHKHTTARKIREIMGPSAGDYSFVAFLRDPREIAVSKYNFYRKGWPYKHWREGSLSFFSRNKPWWRPSLAQRVLLARHVPFRLWLRAYRSKSNAHFILDPKGRPIVDEIGLFDDLQEDFVKIFTNLGYSEHELTLPRKNVTQYDPSDFDFEFVDKIIRKRCAMEIGVVDKLRGRKAASLADDPAPTLES